MPQKSAGWRIDPPVSDPSAATAIREATAAAEPPEDPPGTFVISRGFLVTLKAEFSVDDPMAESSMFVFPKNNADSPRNFLITAASYMAVYPFKIFAPAVHG